MQASTAARQFLSGYFATCERSPKTHAAYQTDLSQFCEFVGARRKLSLVSPEEIEAWVDSLRAIGYKPASIRRKAACVRVFFTYWVRRGKLDQSPFWRVRLSLGRTLDLPRCLELREIRALLRQAETKAGRLELREGARSEREFLALRDLALVDLLFATGLRVGEANQLDLGDFVAAEKTWQVKGKGGRRRLAFLTDPRTVKIQMTYREERLKTAVESEAFFVNRFGRRLSCQGIANAVSGLGRAAALRRRITPHMLRHTVATLLLRNGADLRVVQEFLGHASISTTQRYTHVARDHLVDELKRRHPSKKIRRLGMRSKMH